MVLTSMPPMVIWPFLTSQKRAISLEIVLLPLPEGPTRAVTLPAGIADRPLPHEVQKQRGEALHQHGSIAVPVSNPE